MAAGQSAAHEDPSMPYEVTTEEPIRGQPFGIDELAFAPGILADLPFPGLRAAVRTDHESYPELIEVRPPGSDSLGSRSMGRGENAAHSRRRRFLHHPGPRHRPRRWRGLVKRTCARAPLGAMSTSPAARRGSRRSDFQFHSSPTISQKARGATGTRPIGFASWRAS
jgi:hypothetical protein